MFHAHEFYTLLHRFNHFEKKTMSDIDTIQAALAVTDEKVAAVKAQNDILVNSYGDLAAKLAALQNVAATGSAVTATDLAALLNHISQVNAALDAVKAADAAVAPATPAVAA